MVTSRVTCSLGKWVGKSRPCANNLCRKELRFANRDLSTCSGVCEQVTRFCKIEHYTVAFCYSRSDSTVDGRRQRADHLAAPRRTGRIRF